MKSGPRYPAMVFAFAGDSTMTSFLAIRGDTLAPGANVTPRAHTRVTPAFET